MIERHVPTYIYDFTTLKWVNNALYPSDFGHFAIFPFFSASSLTLKISPESKEPKRSN